MGMNKYAGTCVNCGARVEAGAGRLNNVDNRWVVAHAVCQVITVPAAPVAAPAFQPLSVTPSFRKGREMAAAVEAAQSSTPRVVSGEQTYSGPATGVYTYVRDNGEHRTFRISVQRTDAKFAPGKTIVEYLSGSDNESDYTGFGFVHGDHVSLWTRHKESDSMQALRADVQHALDTGDFQVARSCIRCGRLLTTLESISAGIGPTCAGLGW